LPARVVVTAPGRTTIHVDNPGDDAVVIDATPSGYALDLHGRPRLRAASALAASVRVRPARLAVPGRSTAELSVSVTRAAAARPGDHALVVLLTTRLPTGRTVLAHLRIGVVVVLRIPGPIVRRLTIGGCGSDGIGERCSSRCRSRIVAASTSGSPGGGSRCASSGAAVSSRGCTPSRDGCWRARGLVEARYAGRLRGRLNAVVELARPTRCDGPPPHVPVRL
jgi:hypothetical protein